MRTIGKMALFVLVASLSSTALAAGANSAYKQLNKDIKVSGGPAVLLSVTIDVRQPTLVYVQSDGVYRPGGAGRANAFISIDAKKVSNDTHIDWRKSVAPQPHTFNIIGARYLSKGKHVVSLHATSAGPAAYFVAGTNLSVLTEAATRITDNALPADSANLSFDTINTPEGTALPAQGHKKLISNRVMTTGKPIVAMASGTSRFGGRYGDAMWGIFLNGSEPDIDSMTWSINDIATGAEEQAPMFSQAMFLSPPARSTVQMVASESPYYVPKMGSTNAVMYAVAAGSRLITLSGGMEVYGKALTPGFSYASKDRHRRYAYVCIGTNGFKPTCPRSGTEVVLGQSRVCIPPRHNGVVLFSAKSRVQGDSADAGGTVLLRIKIDGKAVGSTGLQQLAKAPNAVSTRTISASYLATGKNALAPGCHAVQVTGKATGDFRNLSLNADVPLLWFD